jgi:hypothetical protein
MSTTIDATADMLLHGAAVSEVKQLMGAMPPEGLTGVEILAVLAIPRGAKERVDAQQRPPGAGAEIGQTRQAQAAIAEGDTIMTMPDISPEQPRELERLAAKDGDELTEEIVVEAARSATSYLHSLFEWDDAKAARKHRESWADEQRN